MKHPVFPNYGLLLWELTVVFPASVQTMLYLDVTPCLTTWNGFAVGSFFICLWLCWVLVPVLGLSLVAMSRGHSLLWCTSFSLWWLLVQWSTRLQGPQASVLGCTGLVATWHVGSFQSRDWPTSLALAGEFLATGPPGKPYKYFIVFSLHMFHLLG